MTDVHAEARALYQDYLSRRVVLDHLRRYASAVVEATSGESKTPVEPLATMGTHGGPLLCDVCRKPMLLEGGGCQGVPADEGWRRNPMEGWTSYIKGGMVVRIETNGTLRIYHGYPGGAGSGCVPKADEERVQAKDAFRAQERSRPPEFPSKLDLLSAYFKAELPANDNDRFLNEVFRVLFAYDPGLGINRPE